MADTEPEFDLVTELGNLVEDVMGWIPQSTKDKVALHILDSGILDSRLTRPASPAESAPMHGEHQTSYHFTGD